MIEATRYAVISPLTISPGQNLDACTY